MSIIPNEALKPSQSLDLITFEINDLVVTSPYIHDFFNERLAFWKSLVIRNLNTSDACNYRTSPSNEYKTLPPLSERPVQGWGSYFEVVTGAASPNIQIDYIGVSRSNAFK